MTNVIDGLRARIARWRLRRIAAQRMHALVRQPAGGGGACGEMNPIRRPVRVVSGSRRCALARFDRWSMLAVVTALSLGLTACGPLGPKAIEPHDDLADETGDYDPWQPFNETMFTFNHDVLDRYLLKPAAQGWAAALPGAVRRGFARASDNLDMPRRLVNNLLQLRPLGAGRELVRFVVNTSVGVGGVVDVASLLHVEKSDADTGETLALYGVGAGPYLVLPTLPPLTVRDAIGQTADGFLDPIGYFLPFVANRVKTIVTAVNERSLNLQLYAGVEDSVLDLYSAARNGYLQRRRAAILKAAVDRHEQWLWAFGEPEHPPTTAAAKTEGPA